MNSKVSGIQMMPLSSLVPFKNHPFQVRDDADMKLLEQSIIEQGILNPIIVRPLSKDSYEIISGHRRVYACSRIGMSDIPAQVVNMDQNTAAIAMVDSNLQREHILPSEKAFAYAIKLNAMKRQGKRPSTNPKEKGARWSAAAILSDEYGESATNIRRYICLTNLIPEILKKVDEGNIAFTPAVELSSLSEDEQKVLVECMEANACTPSLSQTVTMRKLSRKKELTAEKIESILENPKPNQREKIAFQIKDLRCFFPENYSAVDIQKAIIEMLSDYQSRQSVPITQKENANSDEMKSEMPTITESFTPSQNASVPVRHAIIDEKQIMNMKDIVLCAKENGIDLSEYTLRRAIRGGRIPCRRVGRKYMIMWGNVLNWLNCEDGGDAERIEDDYLDSIPKKLKGDYGKNTLSR